MDFLPDILAGLRFLPTRLGWSPFVLVFKQEPRWTTESLGFPPPGQNLGDLPPEEGLDATMA